MSATDVNNHPGPLWNGEIRWDGCRIVATVVKGKLRLWSRNAIEWTAKVPELAKAISSLGLRSAQLDGEMIVLREGWDNFNALQARLSGEADVAPYILTEVGGRPLSVVRCPDGASKACFFQKHEPPG